MSNETITSNCSFSLEQLSDIINTHFTSPFLPGNLVSTNLEEDEYEGTILNINIGNRDISINRSGDVISSGTFLRSPDNDPDTIPNGWVWSEPTIMISLLKDISGNMYSSTIEHILGEDLELHVAFRTQIWCNDPLCVIRQAAEAAHVLYDEILETVVVIDSGTNTLLDEEYTLTEAFAGLSCEAK